MQSSREHLEHGTVGLPEAERVEVLDGLRAADLEQEAAGMTAVATSGGRLLDDQHPRTGIVGRDCRTGSGRAEAGDQQIEAFLGAHAGGSVIARNACCPSHPSDAPRTIA